MGVWKCTKCGNTTGSSSKPLTGTCSKGGGHRWTAANDNRASIWRCGKCGNTTTSPSRPTSRPCSRGGNCTWQKQS